MAAWFLKNAKEWCRPEQLDDDLPHVAFVRGLFNDLLRFECITAQASTLRGGCCCKADLHKVSLGGYNLAVPLIFDDDAVWVLRIACPESPNIPQSHDSTDGFEQCGSRKVESAVVTMRYLKVHSEIPVPSVYMHDSTTRNPFGAPYIVMDFLPGSPVPVSDFDPQNLDQVAKVYDQICRISYKLLTLRFERIGSLYPSNNEGSVVIGPKDGFSGERYGPFDTAKEYHTALAQLYWGQSRNCALPQLPLPKTWEWASATTMEKDLFTAYLHIQCLSLVDYESDNFRFCFQHGELKLRNILVDAELNVVGVIDWDESSIVPTLSADPLSFCLENDDHIRICKELLAKCEAETESEESELGLSMSQRLWSTSATIARLLESSRLSYRICYAPRLFEHKYLVRWQDAGGLIHDCMEEAISAAIRDTNSTIVVNCWRSMCCNIL